MENNKILDNKCPTCGAQITWNAEKNVFNCKYCNQTYNLEELKKYNNASSDNNNKKTKITEDNLASFNCKNCGAQIIAEENTVSTFCIYCGSTAILKEKIDKGIYPDYVIPFKKTDNDAKEAYKNLLKGKKFLPKNFSDEKNIEKIRGVYIPFWAYDITIDGNIEYRSEDTRSWEDNKYEYKETKTYEVTVTGHYDFEKILCDASKYFNDDLMDSISPFNLEELTNYNHAYLAGFLADKYDVEQKESYEIAKERSKNSCVAKAKTITGHSTDWYTKDNLNYENKKTYYIYLPVYMLNTKFEDQTYTFAMNGQTGKIVGNLPMNKRKFALAIIRTFILTAAIIILIAYLIGEYL